MREIAAALITEAVKKITMEAGVRLEPDILDGLAQARDRESSGLAKNILDLLLVNADIAGREKIPVCQDTGVAVVFIELGQDVHVNGDLGDGCPVGDPGRLPGGLSAEIGV